MKHPLALIVALLAATAVPAVAQDLTLSGESSAPPTSAETDINAGAPLDAQITGDNTYKSLTDAISANESVDRPRRARSRPCARTSRRTS